MKTKDAENRGDFPKPLLFEFVFSYIKICPSSSRLDEAANHNVRHFFWVRLNSSSPRTNLLLVFFLIPFEISQLIDDMNRLGGTVVGIEDIDQMKWPGSDWRCIKVIVHFILFEMYLAF